MKKRLSNLLALGKQRQDLQSGLIKSSKDGSFLFHENLHFALGLFLSKSSENMKEAKENLFRLLHYQISPLGHYPLYLTDYPRWQDSLSAPKALHAFIPIYEFFGDVLGVSLKNLLKERMESAYSVSLKSYFSKKLRGRSLILVCYVIYDYERLFQIENGYGKQALENLNLSFDLLPKTRESLAELFGILTKVPKEYLENFREDLESYYAKASHETLGFVGPLLDESFNDSDLQPSQFEALSTSSSADSMEAFLFYPNGWQVPKENKNSFQGVKSTNYAYSFFKQNYSLDGVPKSRACPFFLTWIDKHEKGSLILKAPRADVLPLHKGEGSLYYEFSFNESFESGKRNKGEEISLYLNRLEGLNLHFENKKATCFHLGDTLFIESEKLKLSLKWTLLSGEGTWMGHIALGNRSKPDGSANVQIPPDWKVFLRTIRRSLNVKLALDIDFSFC